MMKREYLEMIPQWYFEQGYKISGITDDGDSLLANAFEGYEAVGFYDFKALYKRWDYRDKCNGIIFVDCDLKQGRCIGNHPTAGINKNAFNLNIFDREKVLKNYFRKYCGSSLLMCMSARGYDISKLSDEVLMILLAVDSTFLGYYSGYDNANKAHQYYIQEVLEYPLLLELEAEKTRKDFEAIQKKYNLKGKVFVDDAGLINTDIKVEELNKVLPFEVVLPDGYFTKIKEYETVKQSSSGWKNRDISKDNDIFSTARTGKDMIKYSVLKRRGEAV